MGKMFDYNVERMARAELVRIARNLQAKRYRDAKANPHQAHHESFCRQADRALEIAEFMHDSWKSASPEEFDAEGNFLLRTKPDRVFNMHKGPL